MRKQRKIKTMIKFLNLTITLMILFISISTVGCGAKGDYIEGYGEDYIEEGEYEYYEEPQETKISDKEMNKLLKKYPDWRKEPMEFAKQAFVTESIENIENSLVNFVDNIIVNNSTYYAAFRYIANPTGLNIVRLDQMNSEKKIEKEVLIIEKVKSIFGLDDYEVQNYPISQYFSEYDYKQPKSPYVRMNNNQKMGFYIVSLAKVKKNGKSQTVWTKVYPNFDIKYESEVKTNRVWTNNKLNDENYQYEYFKPLLNKWVFDFAVSNRAIDIDNLQKHVEEYNEKFYKEYGQYGQEMIYRAKDIGVRMPEEFSNYMFETVSNNFKNYFGIDYSNLTNKDYVFPDELLKQYRSPYYANNYYYIRDKWTNIENTYKKDLIINFEGLYTSSQFNIRNIYASFIDEIMNIYINYTYHNKLPSKK